MALRPRAFDAALGAAALGAAALGAARPLFGRVFAPSVASHGY